MHIRQVISFICCVCLCFLTGCGGTGVGDNGIRRGMEGPGTATTAAGEYLYANGGTGILAYRVSKSTGQLTPLPSSVAPSATANRPNGLAIALQKYIYVTNSFARTVSTYAISTTGDVSLASVQPAGSIPVGLVVASSGRYLYVFESNGTIDGYNINPSTGALTAIIRPFGGGFGIHAFAIDTSGQRIYVADNFAHEFRVYSVGTNTGALVKQSATTYSLSSNIVDLAVHPTSGNLFAVDAQPSGGRLFAYAVDEQGRVATTATSEFSLAAVPIRIAMDRTGTFTYLTVSGATVSGAQGVAEFTISQQTGALSLLGISAATFPSEITVDASGKFVYVASPWMNAIYGYAIRDDGTLTPAAQSPYASSSPGAMVTLSQ